MAAGEATHCEDTDVSTALTPLGKRAVSFPRLQYLNELLRNGDTYHLEFHFLDCAVCDLLPLHVTLVVIGGYVTLPCYCCTLSNKPNFATFSPSVPP